MNFGSFKEIIMSQKIKKVSDEEVMEFINEYEKLCRKYKIIIDSCGCCASPYIYCNNGKEKYFSEACIDNGIKHLKEEYFGDNYSD